MGAMTDALDLAGARSHPAGSKRAVPTHSNSASRSPPKWKQGIPQQTVSAQGAPGRGSGGSTSQPKNMPAAGDG